MAASPKHHVRILLACLLSLPLVLACRDNSVTAPDADDLRVRFPVHIDLGTLGGTSSFANDINRNGTVVGSADNAAGQRRAFRWTALGGIKDLGTLPGDDWSSACCITDNGTILGTSGSSSGSTTHGTTVIWSPDGTITALDIPLLPGAPFGMASGFNERGDVVGWDAVVVQHPWIWSAAQGKYDIATDIPDGAHEGSPSGVDPNGLVLGTNNSHTAGCLRAPACWRPYFWSFASGYRELGTPDADSTAVATALGWNGATAVVGWARTFALGSRPYVWREGEGFTILSSSDGYATSINARGTAVGALWDPALSAYQATAWPRSGGPVRLSPNDPNPQIATAVNDMGVVVGWSALSPDGHAGHHATLWLLGPASQALVALATSDAQKLVASAPSTMTVATAAAGAAAIACLSDTDALISRSTLFACVARSAGGLPSDGHPR